MRSITLRAGAVAAAVLTTFLAATASSAQTPPVASGDGLTGTVGVCIRWGADPAHVEEALVVAPSRNDALNSFVTTQIKAMEWQRPKSDYHGEWEGVNLVFGHADPDSKLPDCRDVHDTSSVR
jgi:hypothetical protein